MATEKRLIDASNLSVMIEETAQGLADCDQQNAAWALRKYALRDIAEAPTVDAVEVVHGYWITTDTILGKCCKCSVCGSNPTMEYRYCPYCGARMDGRPDNG